MAQAFDTVSDYVTETRATLQDTVLPYRYDDPALLSALNIGMLEIRRIRPDLFIGVTTFPKFTVVDSTAVGLDLNYRTALIFFMAGYTQLRDDEVNQDSRATALINMGIKQLTVAVA